MLKPFTRLNWVGKNRLRWLSLGLLGGLGLGLNWITPTVTPAQTVIITRPTHGGHGRHTESSTYDQVTWGNRSGLTIRSGSRYGRSVPHHGGQGVYRERRINDSVLVNPVIIDSDIRDSTLVNPTVIDSHPRGNAQITIINDRSPHHQYPVDQSRPATRRTAACTILAEYRAACQ